MPPSFIRRSSRSSCGFVTVGPNHHQRIITRLSSGGFWKWRSSSATLRAVVIWESRAAVG